MYIQIGNEVSVRERDIVGIFNVDTTFRSKDSSDFLKISDEEGFVYKSYDYYIKSVVITEIDNKSKIFLSPISSHTLIKRIGDGKN